MKLHSVEVIVSNGMDKFVIHTDLVTESGDRVSFLTFLPKGTAVEFAKSNFSAIPMKITRT